MANVINMGGSGANIESKTVKSSQTQQTIAPPDGVDGFNPVIVNPFTLQSKTVSPSISQQIVKPDTGKDGLSQVTVNSMKLQSKSNTPSSLPFTYSPDSGYEGLSSVTVAKPSNLIAKNIAYGERIFGIIGAYPKIIYTEQMVNVSGLNVQVGFKLPEIFIESTQLLGFSIMCFPGSVDYSNLLIGYTGIGNVPGTNEETELLGNDISSDSGVTFGGAAQIDNGYGMLHSLNIRHDRALNRCIISNMQKLTDTGNLVTLYVTGTVKLYLISYTGDPIRGIDFE